MVQQKLSNSYEEIRHAAIHLKSSIGMILIKSNFQQGLGFSIVGGFGSPHGDMPIYVKTVFQTGSASESGELKRGDQVILNLNI